MYLENLGGLVVLSLLTVVMLLVVPREKIRHLAGFGAIFGLVFPFFVIGVMQNLLGFWDYRGVDPVTVAGIPVFLAISWFPGVVIFAHLLMELRFTALRVLLFLVIGSAVAGLHYLLLLNNMVVFNNWNLTGSFLLTVGIHVLLAGALHAMGFVRLAELVK